MPQHKPNDYRYIRAWGQMMSSHEYYIKQQQELAAEEGAPLDAIFKDGSDVWHTFSQVTITTTIDRMNQLLERIK
jgi:hypothetical protein